MPRKPRPEAERARRSRSRRRPNVLTTTDWALGQRPAPFIVEQPGPYRPDLLLLMDAGADQVVAIEVAEPGRTPADVAAWAAGRLPRGVQVRVEEPGLAEALRSRVAEGIAVHDASTPEIDEALDSLEQYTNRSPRESGNEPSWSDDAASEAKAGFYAAAARFERSRPWEQATDGHVLSVDVAALGWKDGCAAVLGNLGETFGLLLLQSVADYETFVRVADLSVHARRRSTGGGVRLLSVNFDRPRDLPGGRKLAKEARAHGFVTGPSGRVPYILNTGLGAAPTPPTTDDYRLATACLEAVRRFVEKNADLFSGPPRNRVVQTSTVVMPGGEVEVRVAAPPRDLPWAWGVEEPIEGLRRRDREQILDAFHGARLKEGVAPEEADADRWAAEEMLEYRARVGASLADCTPEAVEAFLLDYYPSHGLDTGDELQATPARLDAFLGWLGASGRADSRRVDAARRRLGECRQRFLKEAGDPRRFGPAKTVAHAMREAGVDPTDTPAVERFLDDFNRRVQEDPSILPVPSEARPRKAWVWDGKGLPPDPSGPCPCGSGRRYRKCCMPR
jgi:hypothetical protein